MEGALDGDAGCGPGCGTWHENTVLKELFVRSLCKPKRVPCGRLQVVRAWLTLEFPQYFHQCCRCAEGALSLPTHKHADRVPNLHHQPRKATSIQDSKKQLKKTCNEECVCTRVITENLWKYLAHFNDGNV